MAGLFIWVKTGPTVSFLDRILRWRNLLRTVWEYMLRKPRIPAAVVAAVTVRLRSRSTLIYRSWTGVVMRDF
jgi:hypothetical protein